MALLHPSHQRTLSRTNSYVDDSFTQEELEIMQPASCTEYHTYLLLHLWSPPIQRTCRDRRGQNSIFSFVMGVAVNWPMVHAAVYAFTADYIDSYQSQCRSRAR